MMLDMILLEHHGKRHTNGHVGDNRKQSIRLDSPEREIMGNLVYGEERILVGGASDGPGEEEEGEGEEGGVAERVGREELDARHEEDDVFG
jgi:hypothetical protein